MDIHIAVFLRIPEIFFLEFEHRLVGVGNDEIGQQEGDKSKYQGGNKKRNQHPPETDSTAENSNDLAAGGHPGGKKDDRDKGQKITEKVYKIGNEINVIVEDDRTKRCIIFQEVIDLL